MNTFNSITVDTAERQLKTVASLGMVFPKTSKRDSKKVDAFITTIRNAAIMGDKHLPNSDRVIALTNAITQFNKLNAGVLDGGLKLKQGLIELAWMAYSKLEVNGINDSHFTESRLPCDDRNKTYTSKTGDGFGSLYSDAKNKIKHIHPDSKYPDQEWALLELAEMFG